MNVSTEKIPEKQRDITELRRAIEQFEATDSALRQIISRYQGGLIDYTELTKRLSAVHNLFIRVLDKVWRDISVSDKLIQSLETAYGAILSGKEKYLIKSPNSYHQIIFEIHRLLVDLLKKGAVRCYGASFIGWEKKGKILKELRMFAKKFNTKTTKADIIFLKTDSGWAGYISAGLHPLHFTTVESTAERLKIVYSDFSFARTMALAEVLREYGFKQTGFETLTRVEKLKDGTESEDYNFIAYLQGSNNSFRVFMDAFFRSNTIVWTQVKADTLESATRREIIIMKRMLQDYIKRPVGIAKISLWGGDMFWSDLYETLGSCSDEEAVRIVDKILSEPAERARKIIKEKYHINMWKEIPRHRDVPVNLW